MPSYYAFFYKFRVSSFFYFTLSPYLYKVVVFGCWEKWGEEREMKQLNLALLCCFLGGWVLRAVRFKFLVLQFLSKQTVLSRTGFWILIGYFYWRCSQGNINFNCTELLYWKSKFIFPKLNRNIFTKITGVAKRKNAFCWNCIYFWVSFYDETIFFFESFLYFLISCRAFCMKIEWC